MIRKPTQRPTEKTARPRRPFFIGSRPDPVFRGGIFLSLPGRHEIVLLQFVTAGEILKEPMTKCTFHYFLVLQRSRRSMNRVWDWDSLPSAEEYCSSATARRAPWPPCSYGVSAAVPQRSAEPGVPRAEAGGAVRWRAASPGHSSVLPARQCDLGPRRSGIGLRRSYSPPGVSPSHLNIHSDLERVKPPVAENVGHPAWPGKSGSRL